MVYMLYIMGRWYFISLKHEWIWMGMACCWSFGWCNLSICKFVLIHILQCNVIFYYKLHGLISQSDNWESERQAKCQTVGSCNGMPQVSLRDRYTLQGQRMTTSLLTSTWSVPGVPQTIWPVLQTSSWNGPSHVSMLPQFCWYELPPPDVSSW